MCSIGARCCAGEQDIVAELGCALLLDGYSYRHALALRPNDALTRADLAASLFEARDRQAGEAALRQAIRGRPELFGRAVHALTAASHGRVFFSKQAAIDFLEGR
jgi:hypothetical protein